MTGTVAPSTHLEHALRMLLLHPVRLVPAPPERTVQAAVRRVF